MLTARIRAFEFVSQLQRQWPDWIARMVNLLLILWLGYQLTRLMQMFLPASQEHTVINSDPVAAPAQSVRAPRISAGKLAEMHLFGVPVAEQHPPREPATIEAPDTRLKIVLHGTFASDDSLFDHAIIADTSGNEESYTIGDEIADGILVHAIFSGRVILRRDQRYETLHLLHDDLNDIVIASGLTPTQKTDDRLDISGLPTVKKLPRSLDDMVRPQPVRISGKFIGFRLKPIKDPDFLVKLGLLQEDVVTWLNEVELDNPMKGMQALKSISSGDYVNMTVRRDGQDMSLSFYLP